MSGGRQTREQQHAVVSFLIESAPGFEGKLRRHKLPSLHFEGAIQGDELRCCHLISLGGDAHNLTGWPIGKNVNTAIWGLANVSDTCLQFGKQCFFIDDLPVA